MRLASEAKPRTTPLRVGMRTVFQDVILLTWAVSPDALATLLPPHVHPFVHDSTAGPCSYVSIVIANMRRMRPGFVPESLGVSAYQIVYRAVVELHPKGHPPRRGVFFLRTDCNDAALAALGNRMTEFRFHYFHASSIGLYRQSPVPETTGRPRLLATVETRDGAGDLVALCSELGPADALPPAPGFTTVGEEKETLVQLFHAFAEDPELRMIHDMRIRRGDWRLQRLAMDDHFSAFFGESPFTSMTARPVSALSIHECDYIWYPTDRTPLEDLQVRPHADCAQSV